MSLLDLDKLNAPKWYVDDIDHRQRIEFDTREAGVQFILDTLYERYPDLPIANNGAQYWVATKDRIGTHSIEFVVYEGKLQER